MRPLWLAVAGWASNVGLANEARSTGLGEVIRERRGALEWVSVEAKGVMKN